MPQGLLQSWAHLRVYHRICLKVIDYGIGIKRPDCNFRLNILLPSSLVMYFLFPADHMAIVSTNDLPVRLSMCPFLCVMFFHAITPAKLSGLLLLIWCIKTYIIAYVKTQKIRYIIHYVKPTAQLLFKIRLPKSGPTCRRKVVNPRHTQNIHCYLKLIAKGVAFAQYRERWLGLCFLKDIPQFITLILPSHV